MMTKTLLIISLLFGYLFAETPPGKKKPNIVLILADDLGWDDVSFHGSPQIPTPNIDALALSGVILNNYYVSPSSFATKCEIMTGKYATRLGVQHGVIHNKQPVALPENEKILPQYMKELGYNTHAVGKWSLGFYKDSLLPWNRGFDTFYGGLTSSGADYYTYSAFDENYGLDLRRNEEVVHNETGHYITNIYTKEAVKIINEHNDSNPLFLYVAHQAVHSGNADDPLQAPVEYVKKVAHIRNSKRRLFGGMVTALDESLQNITIALSSKGLLDNTVIIFSTTAGGAVGGMELNSGSNFPLRGSKMTVWEGGIRGVAFVYSSEKIQENSRVNEEMFHAADWMPTILGLAGGDWKSMKTIDGFNVWDAISNENYMSPRFEILHQFDPLQKNQCAIRVGDYKLIINQDLGFYGDWYPRPAEVGELQDLTKPSTLPNAKVTCDKSYPHPFLEMHAPPCDPMRKPCLFNIQWDPCEFHNLADFMPNTLKVLLDRLHYYRTRIIKPSYPKFDPEADPEFHDGVWGPWINTTNLHDDANVAFVPDGADSNAATLLASANNATLHQPHTKDTVHPHSGVMKVISPSLGSNISFPATMFEVNKTTDSVIPSVATASFMPTASSIPYTPYQDISTVTAVPENYTIPALPTTYTNGTVTESNSTTPTKTFDSISDLGMPIHVVSKTADGSKTQNHEFTTVIGDVIEGGNVDTSLNVKGKTTHVDLVRNDTSPAVGESTTLDQFEVNKNRNVTATGVAENGITLSSTVTNTQQNMESMTYDAAPVAGAAPAAPAVDSTPLLNVTLPIVPLVPAPAENATVVTPVVEVENATVVAPPEAAAPVENATVAPVPVAPVAPVVADNATAAAPENVTAPLPEAPAAPVPAVPGAPLVPLVPLVPSTPDNATLFAPFIPPAESAPENATVVAAPEMTPAAPENATVAAPPPATENATVSAPAETAENATVEAPPPAPPPAVAENATAPEATAPAAPAPVAPVPPEVAAPAVTAPENATVVPAATAAENATSQEPAPAAPEAAGPEVAAGSVTPVETPKAEPGPPPVPAAPAPAEETPAVVSPYDLGKTPDTGVSPPLVPLAPLKPAEPVPLPPAQPAQPAQASLRPKGTGEGSSLGMGEGSDVSADHDVSVSAGGGGTFSEAKTDSKLPALQNPHVIAGLNNLAEAGKPGKSGMASEVAILTGTGIPSAKGQKAVAQNFIKEPKYDSPDQPAYDMPEDPFSEFKSRPPPNWSKHETAKTGTATSAGSTTESETVVGAGASTGSSAGTGKKAPKKGPKLADDKEGAEKDDKGEKVEAAEKAPAVPSADTKEEAVAKDAAAPLPANATVVTIPTANLVNKTVPEVTVAKASNNSIGTLGGPALTKPKLDSFLKPNKAGLVNSLKAISLTGGPGGKGMELGLATGHNDLPNSDIAGHRTFQSVVDLVSDSSNQNCVPGTRDCIPHQGPEEGQKEAEAPNIGSGAQAKTEETPATNATEALPAESKAPALDSASESGTQATSNQTPSSPEVRNATTPDVQAAPAPTSDEPLPEKLHKFFGEIKVDNKKMFYVSGTASEEKDVVFPSSASVSEIPPANNKDVKKHNIGFNIMMPSNDIHQVTPSPKFKERAKIEGATKYVHMSEGGRVKASKSEIKKVFDMISDPTRTRKMKVPEAESSQKVVAKGNIADDSDLPGDTLDMGAMKPTKGSFGAVSESKSTIDVTPVDMNSTADSGTEKKSKAPSSTVEAGDLGSIVTLVGKVKVDRLSSKRTKHNTTKDAAAAEKAKDTKSPKIISTVDHMKHNGTETNAANIDKLSGPSNSIIVSSVIVVLIASFVVVGMAVVAVVAVVARHCRIGKNMEAT